MNVMEMTKGTKKKDAKIPCKNYILMALIVYLHGKNKILLFQNTFMIALLFQDNRS